MEELECDKSYEKQMTPQKSKHWYVRHCDWWCQRFTDAESGTYFSVVIIYLYVACFFCFFDLITDNIPWFWWGALSIILKPDEAYRFFRHSYFKKHNLPGPYGWGTLDKHESWTYCLPLTTVLGL